MNYRVNLIKRALSAFLAFTMLLSLPYVAFALDKGKDYEVGEYSGSADGFKGKVYADIILSESDSGDKYISNIDVSHDNESAKQWEKAFEVIDSIIESNGTEDVETISGATFSSRAIIDAVNNALDQAVIENDDAIFSSGSGTEKDPYMITSLNNLRNFSKAVNSGEGYAGKYISLGRNIDLDGIDWEPVGTATNAFKGNFNGNNHVISNMTIGRESEPLDLQYASLFGYVTNSAEFHNVNLEGVSIFIEPSKSAYAGTLAAFSKVESGSNTGTVFNNCHVQGSINVNTSGSAIAGGLTGFTNQNCVIANCGADVEMTLNGGNKTVNAGGLVGFTSVKGVTINSYSLGDVFVSSTGSSSAGGFAGGTNGLIYNCYSTGNLTTSGSSIKAGGFAGSIAAATSVSSAYYMNDGENAELDFSGENRGSINEDTCLGYKQSALMEVGFRDLLSSNLTETKQTAFASELTANGNYENMLSRIDGNFYDWEIKDGAVLLSEKLWVSSEVDTGIFASGSGTQDDPYFIETEEQLREFACSLTDKLDYKGIFISLANNIDITGGDWVPVGEGEYDFNGTFDGCGYKISGIRFGTSDSPKIDTGDTVFYGLFGVLGKSGTIKNLDVDVSIYVSSMVSVYVAGLVGYAEGGLIDSVSVSGTIFGKSGKSANNFVGGISGYIQRSAIINCIASNIDIRSESAGGVAEAGGLVGLNNRGLIANSCTTGMIKGTSDRVLEGTPALGGIAGVHAGTMVNCYSLCEVISDCYSQYVGSLSGWATGIADSFQSYFNTETNLVTDNLTSDRLVIGPAIPIGWSAGPGLTDEGEPYTGSVSLNIQGFETEEFCENAAELLNENLGKLNVDLEKGGRQNGQWTGSEKMKNSLKEWEISDDSLAFPRGSTVTTGYDESTDEQIEKLLPDIYVPLREGTYYGRSDDRTLILKIVVSSDGHIMEIEVVHGEKDYTADIEKVVNDQSSENVKDIKFKRTLEMAINRSMKGDLTSFGSASGSMFDGGTGTESDPWQIATADQLIAFAQGVNVDENYSRKYIKLTKDIILDKEWIPAGSQNHYPFSGHLDGNMKTIKNLTIGSADFAANYIYSGLFTYIEKGVVENLTLDNIFINVANTGSDRIYAGGIASFMDQAPGNGYIDNVNVAGEIKIKSNSGANYSGALLGQTIGGTVTNSSSNIKINASSDASWVYSGALLGMMSRGGVFNSFAEGSINADGSLNKVSIGGITSFHSGVSYNNYTDVELISSSSTNDIGGLAGRNTGIGMMLRGYFSSEKAQKSANRINNPNVGIGVIVSGDRDGMGQATGLKARSSLSGQDFASIMNVGRSDKNSWDEVLKLLKDSWGVDVSEDISLFNWIVQDEDNIVLDRSKKGAVKPGTDIEVSDGNTDDNNGNNDSNDGNDNNNIGNNKNKNNKNKPKNDNVIKNPEENIVKETEEGLIFTDVQESDWFYHNVKYVYEHGMMEGIGNNLFKPYGETSRAMAVTILYRLEGSPQVLESSGFDDVSESDYFANAVAWAKLNGIVKGYSSKNFGPNDSIEREQMAVILMNYASYKKYDLSAEAKLYKFSDADSISDWAVNSLSWANSEQLINGKGNGILDPHGKTIRAEVAAILNRFCERFQ